MADAGASATAAGRPASQRSTRSKRSDRGRTDEETPLLLRDNEQNDEHIEATDRRSGSPASSRSRRSQNSTKDGSSKARRWPSYIALLVLFIVVIVIMFFGFFVPAAMKEYATQAVDFRPTQLSVLDLTNTGVKVKIQGTLVMDASKVSRKATRDLGRLGTWIAKEAETGAGEVNVYLPEYDGVLAGRAEVPPIKINIRNGVTNEINLYTVLEPGSVDDLRGIANNYLDGRLGEVVLRGVAQIPLKSGIISLGRQTVEALHTIQGSKIPSLPKYDISKLNIHERNGTGGVAADASISVRNDYPVELNIPAIGFDVMVDNCAPTDPHITVGNASTDHLHVRPNSKATISVLGDVTDLPKRLTQTCPNSNKSPLDVFVETYIHGEDQHIYVKCCNFPEPHTPRWLRKLVDGVTVPLPLPGRTFGHLLKSFHLKNVHFSLPEALDPDSPGANPVISAQIQALVNLPEEMNFPLDVSHVRADADVYYKQKKLGKLDLHKWQEANATRINPSAKHGPQLMVTSLVDKAPLQILDQDAFTEVISHLFFGGKTVYLEVKALVDVQVSTPIGNFTVPQLPASGKVPVKPPNRGGKGLSGFRPQVGNLEIAETTRESVTIRANVNLTNPTEYSATVPYVNINILANDTVLGQAIAENIHIKPGNNSGIAARAVWQPGSSGPNGHQVGRELISQYLSGYNTTLTFQTHESTFPTIPSLGKALSKLNITIPTPRLHAPKDPKEDPEDPKHPGKGKEEDGPHFILSTTMHLFTSSAEFELLSPFRQSIIYLTRLNATAVYHDEKVGVIEYDVPFPIPPGRSTSPRLPVDWNLGSVGYDAVKNALGGTLKLNASADVGVRIGHWEPVGGLWFQGHGIGAGIRL